MFQREVGEQFEKTTAPMEIHGFTSLMSLPARRPIAGEKMVLEGNLFIEKFLPMTVIREMDEATMSHYRRPFENAGEDRRPTLTFPREVPINAQPEDTKAMVEAYGSWMEENDLPKLFIQAIPGVALSEELLAYCLSWKNQQQITVPGKHFIQEDSPNEIAGSPFGKPGTNPRSLSIS